MYKHVVFPIGTEIRKMVAAEIERQTADLVEVVRCRDCKYAHMTVNGECKYCDIWFPDESEYIDGDYYCASGERKDGKDGEHDS